MTETAELKNVEQDVIEPVDSSEWILPIVHYKKMEDKEWGCVDLREPNTAIVVDGYPLPHMEEMFAELRGAILERH